MRHPKDLLAFLFGLARSKNTQLPEAKVKSSHVFDLLGNQTRSPESTLFLLTVVDNTRLLTVLSFLNFLPPFKSQYLPV